MFEMQFILMASAAALILLGSMRQAERLSARMRRLDTASRPDAVLQAMREGRR
jgi:hypothetical protein